MNANAIVASVAGIAISVGATVGLFVGSAAFAGPKLVNHDPILGKGNTNFTMVVDGVDPSSCIIIGSRPRKGGGCK